MRKGYVQYKNIMPLSLVFWGFFFSNIFNLRSSLGENRFAEKCFFRKFLKKIMKIKQR